MLTLQYIPYRELEQLSSELRIRKLLDIVRKERIIILEGKLTSDEETQLINATMESIDNSFKGIEIATIESDTEFGILRKLASTLLFRGRFGVTLIGPASLVKEIKKDPRKIELFMTERVTKKRSRASPKIVKNK